MTTRPASAATPIAVDLTLQPPPADLSPNARIPWQKKAAYIAAYREGCKREAKSARVAYEQQGVVFPLRAPVVALYTFVLPSLNQRIDLMNLFSAAKAAEDGIVDAGLIADDSIQVVDRVGLTVAQGPRSLQVRLVSEAGT